MSHGAVERRKLQVNEVATRAEELASKGLAVATNSSYSRAQMYFVRFVVWTVGAFPGTTAEEALAGVDSSRSLVVMFVAFMARTCCAASLRVYLAGVRHYYLSRGLWNPCEGNYKLRQALKGLEREKGKAPKRKLPITPEMLRAFASYTNPDSPLEVAFMVAALLAFFTFARKANVTVAHKDMIEQEKVLRRCDVLRLTAEWKLDVTYRHTKTIQFGERDLVIPVLGFKGDPIDPFAWWTHHIRLSPAAAGAHAFCYKAGAGAPRPLTHAVFVARTKLLLKKAGFNPELYSGHSYRRGGATYLFSVSKSVDLIKAMGDWKSTAYQLYITVSKELKELGAAAMRRALFGG